MAFCPKSFVQVRQLSTTAASLQMVKPKIQLFTLEGRYASALFSAASKEKELAKVEKDVAAFGALVKKDKPLRDLLLNPLNKKSLKAEALAFVFAKTKASPRVANVFTAMAENNRLAMINAVVESFDSIMAAERGEVQCEVTTAKALDAAGLKEVTATLQAFVAKGESIKLNTKVDPAIIGGMKVSIGDKYVDMSIASKIKKYTSVISTGL